MLSLLKCIPSLWPFILSLVYASFYKHFSCCLILHFEICLHNCAPCSKFDDAGGPLEDINQPVLLMVCKLLYKICMQFNASSLSPIHRFTANSWDSWGNHTSNMKACQKNTTISLKSLNFILKRKMIKVQKKNWIFSFLYNLSKVWI